MITNQDLRKLGENAQVHTTQPKNEFDGVPLLTSKKEYLVILVRSCRSTIYSHRNMITRESALIRYSMNGHKACLIRYSMNGYKARFARASMMPSRNGRPSTIDCLNHNSNLNLTVQLGLFTWYLGAQAALFWLCQLRLYAIFTGSST